MDPPDLFDSSLFVSIISYGAIKPRVSHLFESVGFNVHVGNSFLVATDLSVGGIGGKPTCSSIKLAS